MNKLEIFEVGYNHDIPRYHKTHDGTTFCTVLVLFYFHPYDLSSFHSSTSSSWLFISGYYFLQL